MIISHWLATRLMFFSLCLADILSEIICRQHSSICGSYNAKWYSQRSFEKKNQKNKRNQLCFWKVIYFFLFQDLSLGPRDCGLDSSAPVVPSGSQGSTILNVAKLNTMRCKVLFKEITIILAHQQGLKYSEFSPILLDKVSKLFSLEHKVRCCTKTSPLRIF